MAKTSNAMSVIISNPPIVKSNAFKDGQTVKLKMQFDEQSSDNLLNWPCQDENKMEYINWKTLN